MAELLRMPAGGSSAKYVFKSTTGQASVVELHPVTGQMILGNPNFPLHITPAQAAELFPILQAYSTSGKVT